MLADDDLYAIAIPESEITPEIEREYKLRQQMYHSRGGQGMLPVDMVIDLLRFCGYEPPFVRPKPKPTDWRNVPLGAAVIVDNGHVKVLGEFVGIIEMGTLAVRIAGRVNLPDFPAHQVSLAPEVLPPDVFTEDAENDQPAGELIDDPAEQVEADEDDDAPVEYDEKRTGPHNAEKWLIVEAGTPVWVNGQSGKFIMEGPSDGQLTVMLDGDDQPTYCDELEVTTVLPASAPVKRKRGRPRKVN